MTVLVLVLVLFLGVPGARSSDCSLSGGRRLLQEPTQAGASPAPGTSDASIIQTLEVDTQVSDCLIFRNRYYDVEAISNARALVTASANQQPVELDCCRSCKNTTGCNVWQWCPHPEGCQIAGVDIDFPYLGCELLHIGGFSPYAQGNLTIISGPGVPFTSGGSVDIVVPDAPGYELIAGADFGNRYDYNCSGSITQGMCELQAPVEEVAGNCTADPNCQAFVYFPDGIDFTGPKPVGILKTSSTGLSRLLTQLNPSAAAYFKGSSNGGGGGSGGGGARAVSESDNNADLIAGIVGGLGGFLLLAGIGAGLLYFRVYRKRKRLAQAVPRGAAEGQGHKEEEGEGSPGSQPSGGGSSEGSGVGRTANGGPPSRPVSELALVSLELQQQQQQQGSLKKGGGSRGSLPRSNSPPSVVDAHMGGLLGEGQQGAGQPEGSEAGGSGSGGQAVELEEGSSPFMFLDPATIAAMQAAAPAVVAFESPVAARGLPHHHSGRSGHSRHSGSPPRSQHQPSLRRELHSGFTAGTATTATTAGGSSGSPARGLQLPALPQGASSGWEEVIVAQLSAARAASAVNTPPGSMAAGSTARELLEAFAKLYRQRPTVDYSALEGVLEVDAQGAGPAGSASVSPQSTLGLGGVGEAAGAAGAAASPDLERLPQQEQQQQAAWPQLQQQQQQQQVQQPRVQFDPGVRGGSGSGGSSSLFGASASASSMGLVLPEMPWSDWALQPEEVEVCRRPDGSWWQLGSGACGTVYKGLYHGVQPVAVKVLHQREDGRRADVFMREVTMLKGLRDRNIVQFLGASLDGVSAMLVTEFMELGDLWRALPIKNHNGERVFGWYRRGRRVALDVARGLHYLHHKRVVHLDLKSANILLSRHGSAKIGDIGMARVLNRDYLTVLSGLGTFAWSAPEVLAGRRCTEKVDIYSFGVVLWEICTGEVPVRGDLRPLVAPDDCPQAVVDLYLRCTAEDFGERPTAIEIVELLSALPHEPPPGAVAAAAAAAAAAVMSQQEQPGQQLASLAPLQAAAAAREEQGGVSGFRESAGL